MGQTLRHGNGVLITALTLLVGTLNYDTANLLTVALGVIIYAIIKIEYGLRLQLGWEKAANMVDAVATPLALYGIYYIIGFLGYVVFGASLLAWIHPSL
ncbi:hypothetical protein D3C78_1417640 [compost metagenome]